MRESVVMLRSVYKDRAEDIRLFDSVSACAVYFAHEARRQYAARGMPVGDLFDAVVQDVALLFAGWDATTGKDPDYVHGGDENTTYSYELRACTDVESAAADAREDDEADRKRRKEVKK